MTWLARTSRELLRLAQPLVPRDRRGVTIFAYHLVGAGTHSVVDLPSDVFRAQLCELRETAHIISLDDAVRHLQEGRNSSRPVVVITFDDAFDNFRTHAWPVLSALRMPCTLYAPVAFLDGTATAPLIGAEALRPLKWDALRELATDPLLTVGSHSHSHGDLRVLDAPALRWDLQHARACLEERTGHAVEHFCYPEAKWSPAMEREVAGVYRTAVLAGGRKNVAGRFNPLRLGRIPLRTDMPAELSPVIESAVCLEEWAASHARGLT